ncbi:Putative auto-transporter adhesin, head GIN domain [Chitinophaga sp. YR627]|uniref:head GIN domain-containing protein n=1 Tax=Chitinophaga sp. YR627 TaxID=1881041 RepID=UPI0008E2E6E0|nr:head GIN domain-containing protein [Chitinophaga sp. YR627]SFO14147.1 Putative auto-transporter adhesin, head GIN domain [Chitinophaga sp. YR627]
MKKVLYVSGLALVLFALQSCGGRRLKGSGNVSTETRSINGSYGKVALKGSMDVEFTQGPAQAAIIEADDNILPYIELNVHDDELVVDLKDDVSIKSHHGIKIKITAPDVYQLSLAGSGNIVVTNTLENTEPVRFKLTGAGNVVAAVNSPKVIASSAGSGDIKLTGETKDLEVSMAGSGNFEGSELHTENTKVTIAGSGNADVHASVKLNAKIVGSGDVGYKGSPEVTSSIAGSGSVHKD